MAVDNLTGSERYVFVNFIKVFLLVMMALIFLLYITGTFSLVAQIRRLIENSELSLFSASGCAKFCRNVQTLAMDNMIQMFLLIAVVYLFMQTFCVPGAILLNAITGAIFGMRTGLLYCILLGTAGACCCYMFSSVVGPSFVKTVDGCLMKGKGLEKVRYQINKHKEDLVVYFIFLRITPILPNWLLNLASPIVGVPLNVFSLATFFGLIPQTYLSVRFGVFARLSIEQDRAIVTLWDTILLAIIGGALLFANWIKKKAKKES